MKVQCRPALRERLSLLTPGGGKELGVSRKFPNLIGCHSTHRAYYEHYGGCDRQLFLSHEKPTIPCLFCPKRSSVSELGVSNPFLSKVNIDRLGHKAQYPA